MADAGAGWKTCTIWTTDSRTWVSELGLQGLLAVAVLKKELRCSSEDEAINNNNINNNNGQVPPSVLGALQTFVRLASRAEVQSP